MFTQVEVEERIRRVMDEMEERVREYDQLARRAANADADYRYQRARMVLGLLDKNMTAQSRDAHADHECVGYRREMLIAMASRDSCRESLSTLREMLNGLRTLAANVRQMV